MQLMKSPRLCVVAVVWFPFFVSGVFAKTVFFSLNSFMDLYAPLPVNNSKCYTDVHIFKKHVELLSPWALQMLDASSKMSPSFLRGNVRDLGNFDQCLDVRSTGTVVSPDIVGKYCWVKVTFNQTKDECVEELRVGNFAKTWYLSVCMPESCSSEDLSQHLALILKDTAASIKVVHCKSSLDDIGLPLTSWMVIIVILMLLGLVLTATWIEHNSLQITHQLAKSVVTSFSLITNGKMLLSTGAGPVIEGMYGIRVISMLAVLATHHILKNVNYAVNRVDVLMATQENQLSNLLGRFIYKCGAIAVDGFFLMSGIVLARGFLAQRSARDSVPFFRYVLHRLFRITPTYLLTIVIYMTVFYHSGSGPIWQYTLEPQRNDCIENWWTNLLYINNYVERACLSWTWYLAAEMQMYIIAPVFLTILRKKPKLGILCITVASGLSCLFVFLVSYRKRLYLDPGISSVQMKSAYFKYIHFPVMTRVPAYFIGLLFGHYLNCLGEYKRTRSLLSRMIGWTIVSITMIAVVFFPPIAIWLGWGHFSLSLHEALSRPLFAAIVGWIVLLCNQESKGVLNRFLSHRSFQVLSKLSFAFFLVHPFVVEYGVSTTRTATHMSFYSLFQGLVFDLVLALFGATALALTVEYPCIRLSKVIF